MQTAKYTIAIQNGETVNRQFKLLTATGECYDLTDYTIDSQIRKEYTSVSASAEFTCEILTPPTSGSFQLSLPATGSAALTGSCYFYDVRLNLSGSIYYPLEGKVVVSPRITR